MINKNLNSSIKNLCVFVSTMILLGVISTCGTTKPVYVNKQFKITESDSIYYYINESLKSLYSTSFPTEDYKTWKYNVYKCQQDTTTIVQYYKLLETKNKQFIYTVIEQDSSLLFMYISYN